MPMFNMNVVEVCYGFIEVNADSIEDAKAIVKEEYHNGNVAWTTSEIISSEAK